jgi:hypothetical protein
MESDGAGSYSGLNTYEFESEPKKGVGRTEFACVCLITAGCYVICLVGVWAVVELKGTLR